VEKNEAVIGWRYLDKGKRGEKEEKRRYVERYRRKGTSPIQRRGDRTHLCIYTIAITNSGDGATEPYWEGERKGGRESHLLTRGGFLQSRGKK